MRRPTVRTLSTAAALFVVVVAACREQLVEPPVLLEPGPGPVDSAAIRAASPPRPPGLFLAPAASDSMVFTMAADSFTVQLTSRECAAPNNWVVLVSPVLDTISATMCQEPEDTVWSFTNGPYAAGTAIVLDFESGVNGTSPPDGLVRFSSTQPASFPQWNLEFEDASDFDWNDFLLRVQAYPDAVLSLSLSADTTELHPWIPEWAQQADNGTIDQALRAGDTTTVTLTVSLSGSPMTDQPVGFTAEFLDRTGGHHHLDDRLLFSNAPSVPQGTASGRPVTGYFKQGNNRVAQLVDTTDASGEVTFAFVAGFVAGDVEVIATTESSGNTFADTLAFRVRVPGLADVETTTIVDDFAYLIGQTTQGSPPDTIHAADSIWYATPAIGDVLERLAQSMVRDSASVTYYVQINDASLPFGGTFSVFPDTTGTSQLMDRPYDRGHRRSHVAGVDVDISWCQVPFTGDDGQQNRISGTNCAAQGVAGVSYEQLETVANRLGILVLTETNPPHFHLRFAEGS